MAKNPSLKVLFEHFGITPELSANNLVAMRRAYLQTLEEVKGTSEKREVIEARIKGEFRKDTTAETKSKELVDAFTETVYKLIEGKPSAAVFLPDLLDELASFMREERDYVVKKHFQSTKPKGIPANAEAKQEMLHALGKTIRGMYAAARVQSSAGLMELPTKEVFPTKELQTGETVPVLPKLSGLFGVTGGGRPSISRYVRLIWNEELVPAEMSPVEAIREIVSTPENRVSWRLVDKRLKETDQPMLAKEESPWILEFPHGILKGFIPSATFDRLANMKKPGRKPKTETETSEVTPTEVVADEE